MISSKAIAAALLVGTASSVFALEPEAGKSERHRAWYVSNNGVDGNTCGSATAPCRSISQAIANAAPNETIVVGPGKYGDLNDDADFDDPGEEHYVPTLGCIVCVTKPLRLVSSEGAGSTVIAGAPASPVFIADVVAIFSAGTTFGEVSKGFTIANGQSVGLHVVDVADSRVDGNIAVNNSEIGFFISGAGKASHDFVTSSNQGIYTVGNWVVEDSVAVGNTIAGIVGSGESIVLRNNVSSNNSRGFTINTTRAVAEYNVASANAGIESSFGFVLFGANIRFEHNTATGNKGYGVYLWSIESGQPTFRYNNIYGNDVLTNCGFANQSGLTVDATHNYWGAASGPGSDPADNAGPQSGCDFGSTTLVTPFATEPFANAGRH